MLIQVLKTALPVFAALFIGVLCRAKAILTRDAVDSLKKVAVNITLPAVLFPAVASADYGARNLLVPALIYLICCLALVVGKVGGKLFKIPSKLVPFLMTGFEAGMLGYGLFAFLYPNEPNAAFALIDLGQCLFVFSLYKILLGGRGSGRAAVRDALMSPVMWSMLIGLLFGATGLYKALAPSGVQEVISNTANFIAAPTSCLILITIGYDLKLKEIRFRRVMGYVLMRVVIMAAMLGLVWAIDAALLGNIIHKGALILMVTLPAPFVLPIFTDAEEERADIASSLSLMTVLSLVAFAVMAAVV